MHKFIKAALVTVSIMLLLALVVVNHQANPGSVTHLVMDTATAAIH
jgi:hypothetical protein